MSELTLDPRLQYLVQPYLGKNTELSTSLYLVADLAVTGRDYLDFVRDVESLFKVDLHSFLVGPNPQYVSTGLAGYITGDHRKPVYRDFTIAELNQFLNDHQLPDDGKS